MIKISKHISEREKELPGAVIGKLLKIAAEDKSILSLGPGEPDFSAPKHIRDAAKKAMDNEQTHYSPCSGRKELLEEIAKKLKKENKISVNTDQIIVTCGSTEAIFMALICLVDPGEEVLVQDPGFLAYIPMVELLNGYPVSVRLKQEDEFQITSEAIEDAIKDPKRVRAFILNTPSNPTGTVLKKKILEEIADVAIEHDLVILSDEAYEKFVYGNSKHISIGSLNGMENYVVTLHSFSKTVAMPGFRIGYAAGPKELISAMIKCHPYTSLSAPTVSQIAATEALRNKKTHKSIEMMRAEYDRRRKLVLKRLNEINGFTTHQPEGAFYAFPSFDFRMNSAKFSEWLLKNARVAVIPGCEFGRYADNFIRLSYATSYEKIKKAMNRIEVAVRTL